MQPSNPSHRLYTPVAGYPAARGRPIAVLSRGELRRAVPALPVAFRREEGGVTMVALMGLTLDRNFFVQDGGRWLGSYVPAAFRGYPFGLASGPDGKYVVCVDENSGALRDGPGAKALFEDDGQPSGFLKQVINFLQQVQADQQATRAAGAVLDRHGLLEDWPIAVTAAEQRIPLNGFLRVSETALAALDPAVLAEVRDSGALDLAYGQIYASNNLSVLGRLAEAHAKAAEAERARLPSAEEMFAPEDISFNFD
nr:SapC family protein [Roseospira goensis]